jgi:hypothetical protein
MIIIERSHGSRAAPEKFLVSTIQPDKKKACAEETSKSYINPEQRVPQDHPLRSLRAMTDEALSELQLRFNKLYAKTGRPSIARHSLR